MLVPFAAFMALTVPPSLDAISSHCCYDLSLPSDTGISLFAFPVCWLGFGPGPGHVFLTLASNGAAAHDSSIPGPQPGPSTYLLFRTSAATGCPRSEQAFTPHLLQNYHSKEFSLSWKELGNGVWEVKACPATHQSPLLLSGTCWHLPSQEAASGNFRIQAQHPIRDICFGSKSKNYETSRETFGSCYSI